MLLLDTGKDPDAGKTEGRNGHECEQAPGDGEGQGGLACCSPRGPKSRILKQRDEGRTLGCWIQQRRILAERDNEQLRRKGL